jgi:hypothetical protein
MPVRAKHARAGYQPVPKMPEPDTSQRQKLKIVSKTKIDLRTITILNKTNCKENKITPTVMDRAKDPLK